MPSIRTSDFHVVCAVLGVFMTCFSFVSYLLKERLYISESLFALLTGVVAGPYAANFLRPVRWAGGIPELETTTLDFARLALSVQVTLAGCQLPGRFVKRSWRSLLAILGPGMVGMWVVSSFLVWAICASPDAEGGFKRMPFLHALAIGACIAPTDPILAATVVKGRWADSHVPARLAQLISAESGANDGLGYPFLYFALYLIQFVGGSGQYLEKAGGAGKAMEMFFGETVGFVIVLSIAWGAAVGYVARKGLKFAESLKYIDNESFYSFAVILAVLLIGTCGMVGSDDILACFVAGNVLSWDDWFRRETANDSFEPTVDMLLNTSIFIYFGAVCPWESFAPHIHTESFLDSPLPIWRLICLGISILALRRVPVVVGLHVLGWLRPHVSSLREAGFMGFFGPIGVSAIFYLHVMLEYLRKHIVSESGDEELRTDVRELFNVAQVCVWFVVVCSVIVHGLSIPSYQLGIWFSRHTWNQALDEHRYSIRTWLAQERDAVKHHAWLSRLRDEEERIKHARVWQRQAPVRPEPSFRRVRMHPEQEASQPQG